MDLTVAERLMLLNIMPAEGNITDLKIIRKLREELSFSEAEHETFELKHNPETRKVTWNPEKVVSKDVLVGRTAREMLLQVFARRADLTDAYIDLYDRFVGAGSKD